MTEIRDLTDLFYLFPNETKGDEQNDKGKAVPNPCLYPNA